MNININTKKYWDNRFETSDWEVKNGRQQTRLFAEEQCMQLDLPRNFQGVITDFGCGLGDAIPVYRKYFPSARLRGYDISSAAIQKCKLKYGEFAEFRQGTEIDIMYSDVIISSNVFEHLSDDISVAKLLLEKSKYLYIAVPYNEKILPNTEHVNTYNESSFEEFDKQICRVYITKGQGYHGLLLFWHVYLKNIIRFALGKPVAHRSKQVIFKLCSAK